MVVADLSHGGVKLEGPFHLSTGDTIELDVEIGQPVRLAGRVVMAYPSTPGTWAAHVSFIEGQTDAAALVDEFITFRLRQRATTRP